MTQVDVTIITPVCFSDGSSSEFVDMFTATSEDWDERCKLMNEMTGIPLDVIRNKVLEGLDKQSRPDSE